MKLIEFTITLSDRDYRMLEIRKNPLYKTVEEGLIEIAKRHIGDVIDNTWWLLSKEDREKLNAEFPDPEESET